MAGEYLPLRAQSPLSTRPRSSIGQRLQKSGFLTIVLTFLIGVFFLSRATATSRLTQWSYRQPVTTFASGPLPATYTGKEHYPRSIVNATLGFGKIIVINLQHRHDKRDELSLMAKAAGLELEFFHPILPSELKHEGLPPHIGGKKGLNPPNESAFRAHADVWRSIMLGDKETALVLEDDIDWDVLLRDSLRALSAPMAQFAASETMQATSISEERPWQHQAWDTLFLGACVENDLWHENAKKFVDPARLPVMRFADERTPDFDHWSYDFTKALPLYNVSQPGQGVIHDQQPRQRVVARAVAPACSAAYGLTRAGAARMLHHVTRQYDGDTDVSMANALVDNYVKGYIVMPSIFGQWRIEKSQGNSDLHFKSNGETLAQQLQKENLFDLSKGDNRDVRTSTRANLKELIAELYT